MRAELLGSAAQRRAVARDRWVLVLELPCQINRPSQLGFCFLGCSLVAEATATHRQHLTQLALVVRDVGKIPDEILQQRDGLSTKLPRFLARRSKRSKGKVAAISNCLGVSIGGIVGVLLDQPFQDLQSTTVILRCLVATSHSPLHGGQVVVRTGQFVSAVR